MTLEKGKGFSDLIDINFNSRGVHDDTTGSIHIVIVVLRHGSRDRLILFPAIVDLILS